MSSSKSRRQFLLDSGAFAVGASVSGNVPRYSGTVGEPAKPRSKIERLGIGAIGLRYQGSVITAVAKDYADVVAVCDVDKNVRDQAKAAFGSTPASYEDYRELLDNKNVDIVLIGTPDHWHTKMVVDSLRAGKDVYVEKPLTLTVDEGKLLRKVASETARVVQVGSWQRSDHRFRLAVEMVRQGRIGKLQRVDVVLGKNARGGPFEARKIPGNLNWNLWQGQTQDVPYVEERCHYTFRWWYEYSGGQITDWGAHHIDIAQWAINSYPIEIHGNAAMPSVENGFNVAVDYSATVTYASNVTMTVSDSGRNGILFTGDKGRIFVNRGVLSGKPVENLAREPLDREIWNLYPHDNLTRPPRMGKLDAIKNHMGNFFDCVDSRKQPISDIESQHRSVTTCHLSNISMRLGRPLNWDSESEAFVDDRAANDWLRREQRQGFELE